MLKRPAESLGVVTLNQTQRELIEELLDKKLKTFEEGAEFLGRWEAEGWPFFVKNLENVQGDERDVIFISTTFGKAAGTDKVRQNFGPISRPDGWRRLNVLFTRSKRRIELFTSMGPEDIIVDSPRETKDCWRLRAKEAAESGSSRCNCRRSCWRELKSTSADKKLGDKKGHRKIGGPFSWCLRFQTTRPFTHFLLTACRSSRFCF